MNKENNKPICIIPARAGSKGLKNKNMLFLSGKPLIFHTIDAVINSGVFRNEDIYVSTDSLEYKEIIENYRPIKVLLRSEELASDTATTYDMLEDFLKDFSNDTDFMLCQPTSPLRSSDTVLDAYEAFIKNDCDNLVSFSEADKSLKLFSSIDENGCPKDIIGIDRGYRRQEEKKQYYPNGAVFISKKYRYLENKSFFTERTFAYVMNKSESIDVDDKYDFINAIGGIYFNYRNREKNNKNFYKEKYKAFANLELLNKVIIGDSRMENIQLDGFSNISVGGITTHTVYENIDYILNNRKVNEIFLALGVNDLITGYGVEATINVLNDLIVKLLNNNIKLIVSKVIYTIFRYEVNNNEIEEINKFLESLAESKVIKLINPNEIISINDHLNFKYTSDGLHMNNEGDRLLKGFYNKSLNCK